MDVYIQGKGKISLNQSDFVAQGGEGAGAAPRGDEGEGHDADHGGHDQRDEAPRERLEPPPTSRDADEVGPNDPRDHEGDAGDEVERVGHRASPVGCLASIVCLPPHHVNDRSAVQRMGSRT